MSKKKRSDIQPSDFITDPVMEINGFLINAGDTIKVSGQWGSKFKFVGVTTNIKTGSSWVDCFEIIGTVTSVYRSFKKDTIKRIPQKRSKVVKNG
jgi:hypothetical protein